MSGRSKVVSNTSQSPKARTETSISEERFTDNYLPYLLAQASAAVCAEFAEPIRRARVGNLAWRILASLRDEGEMSVGDLSKVVLTIQPRVTQVISGLEGEGLVTRHRDAVDRRRTLVRITRKGRRRVEALLTSARECEDAATAPLTPPEVDQLKQLLKRLLANRTAAGTSGGPLRPAAG